jgi:hypothetical protein
LTLKPSQSGLAEDHGSFRTRLNGEKRLDQIGNNLPI